MPITIGYELIGGRPGISSGSGTAIDNQFTANVTMTPANSTTNVVPSSSINSATCAVCPGSNFTSSYYLCLTVANATERVPISATLDGIQGQQHNSNNGQFSFDARGLALFNPASTVRFHFDDNSSASFKLGKCRKT